MAGIHLDSFIPQNVVTAKLIMALQAQRVLTNVVQHKTVVDLGKGQTYLVPNLIDTTTGDYTGADITWVAGADEDKTITIDQSKYFAAYVDRVDNAESAKQVLGLLAQNGVSKLAQAEDVFLATKMSTQAGITGTDIGTAAAPLVITDANVIDYFATLQQKCDDNNVPEDGRFAVVPPFITTALNVANVVVASTTDDTARVKGYVTEFFGFEVYKSNNLVKTDAVTAVHALVGSKMATYEVDTLRDIEFTSLENKFADGAKGLHVYGAEVLTPTALAVSVVSNA